MLVIIDYMSVSLRASETCPQEQVVGSPNVVHGLPETFLDRIAFYMIISNGTYHCMVIINHVM